MFHRPVRCQRTAYKTLRKFYLPFVVQSGVSPDSCTKMRQVKYLTSPKLFFILIIKQIQVLRKPAIIFCSNS